MPPADDRRDPGSTVERAAMMALLDEPLLTRAELVRAVAGTHDSAVDVEDAIEALYGAGLIHIIDGQFLLASHAARRTDQLAL